MITFLYHRFIRQLARHWTRAMWQEKLWREVTWQGVQILQWPTDLAVLQEIIWEQKPKVIIETGTYRGGTALFFASMLKLLNNSGKVITIDKYPEPEVKALFASHPLGKNIIALTGDSGTKEILKRIRQEVKTEKRCLVFLDSDHSYRHVLAELNNLSQFVPKPGYICAFDTITKDLYDVRGASQDWKTNNPHQAVHDFLSKHPEFAIDTSRNRLLVGFGPDAFLKRIKK